jgi:hypothetical protein
MPLLAQVTRMILLSTEERPETLTQNEIAARASLATPSGTGKDTSSWGAALPGIYDVVPSSAIGV